MEIKIEKLKQLILKMEPDPITQGMLQMDGYGSVEYTWIWNKERIRELNEKELLNLIDQIAWT